MNEHDFPHKSYIDVTSPPAEVPAGTTSIDPEGTVGTGNPAAVFAKVFRREEVPEYPYNPWVGGTEPTQAHYLEPLSGGLWEWRCPSIELPTGATEFTLLVWGIDQGSSGFYYHPHEFQFNNGSGSGAAYKVGAGHTAVCEGQTFDVLPRTYKLAVDVSSLNLGELGGGFLLDGLLCSDDLYLTYDQHAATPQQPVWSGGNLADAAGAWTLRICQGGGGLHASMVLQRLSQHEVEAPLMWVCDPWEPFAANVFVYNRPSCSVLAMPTITVVPA